MRTVPPQSLHRRIKELKRQLETAQLKAEGYEGLTISVVVFMIVFVFSYEKM